MGFIELLDQMFKAMAILIIFGVLSFIALVGLIIYMVVS